MADTTVTAGVVADATTSIDPKGARKNGARARVCLCCFLFFLFGLLTGFRFFFRKAVETYKGAVPAGDEVGSQVV